MAALAGRVDVRSRQRELRTGVIEPRTRPLGSRMTDRAIRGEPCSRMVRTCRRLVLLQMTRRTCSRRSGISVVHVTLRAGDACVGSGQRKVRVRIVVKPSTRPLDCRVAGLAGRRKHRRYVVRIRCALVCRDMTRVTVGRCSGITIVRVTLRARGIYVHAG